MSRYLVTGATGFLGAHLVTQLTEQGHDVVAMARSIPTTSSKVTWRKGDVLAAESVKDAAAGCDGVFHCAGFVSRKREDAEALYRVHVEGTKTALAACREAGVKRAVVASTSGTVCVSPTPEPVRCEDDEAPIGLLARWPYYRAKLFAERAAFDAERAGFDVVCVNPSLLLGPGDERGSSTDDVRRVLEQKIPAAPNGGVSFVDVRDAAAATILAMERGESGKRYLVGACNLPLRDFLARVARLGGVRAPALPMPTSPALSRFAAEIGGKLAARAGLSLGVDPVSVEMAHYYWYVDSTRAETQLGWRARNPNETIADTIADLRARGAVWPREEART